MRFIPILSKSENYYKIIVMPRVVNLTLYKKIQILIAYQGIISIPNTNNL